MRVIHKIVVVAFLCLATVGCRFEAAKTRLAALSDVLPASVYNLNLQSNEVLDEIEPIIDIIREAKKSGNSEKCDEIPNPKTFSFSHGDYSSTTPSRDLWVLFCSIVVSNTNDPSRCLEIQSLRKGPTIPYLEDDCKRLNGIPLNGSN